MRKQEELFRHYEKLSKADKSEKPKDKPGCCKRCIHYRPDFKLPPVPVFPDACTVTRRLSFARIP